MEDGILERRGEELVFTAAGPALPAAESLAQRLAAERPDLVGHGLLLMDRWMGERMREGLRGDPFWGIIAEGGPLHANERSPWWQRYCERLRQTGRGHHADRLEEMGGRPFTSGLE